MALSASLAFASGLVDGSLLARLGLVLAVTLAVAGVAAMSRPRVWYRQLTDRLLYGVPWGTLIVMAIMLAVYAGLQDGIGSAEPIVLPFRAWSYLDPVGMLVAGFAHSNTSHLLGNLLGTLLFGSLAEYLWGHHTTRRTTTRPLAAWTHPVVRAVVIFPAAAILGSIVGSLVALGPIIGFSMVVFAFAGFALVQAPILAVVVSVSQGVVRRLFDAFQTPEQIAASGTTYSTPWFASIAIQGHAVGLLAGVLVGLGYQRLTRRARPSVGRLWAGVLLFAVERSLWAVYWYRGAESYVLYRAIGVGLVFLLAALVTYAVIARDEPLVPGLAVPNPQTMLADMTTISHRQVALLLVIAASSFLVSPAIAANATTIADADLPGEAVEVRGYELTYGENVTDGQINVFDIRGFGETTRVNTSGVIVRNTDRHIWSTAVSRGELAVSGSAAVRLGGIGWQETVTATREEWRAVGGDTTYRVSLTHNNTTRPLYTSPAATAEPVVAGQRITLNATDGGFRLTVGDETAPIPTQGNVTTLNGIQFSREDDRLVAIHDRTDTAVRVATKVN